MTDVSQHLHQTARILEATPQVLAVMLAGMDDEILVSRPAPGEWTIKEIIGHLIDTGIHAFGSWIRLMLAEDRPVLPAWDMKGAVIARRANEQELASLLDELAAGRPGYAQLVRGLSETDLRRPCVHRSGEMTIRDFVFEWPYHDHNHIAQIANNIQVTFLPLMGEVMRKAIS